MLSEERAALLQLWELRRQQYEQCMDLQLFYRDTEQVDNWMSKQEVTSRQKPRQPRGQQSLFRLLFGWLTWATKSLPFQSQSNEGGGTEPASVTCAFVSPCCSSGQTLRKGPGFSDEGDGVKLITEIVFFKP